MHALPITYSECGDVYSRTVDAGLRSILFLASEPGEGSSTLAYAVAQRAVASGKRVLFVDFNTRSSYPRDVLQVPAGSWVLGEPVPAEAFTEVSARGLTILPAPVERSFGIDARRSETVRDSLKLFLGAFDVVIGDSPCLSRPNGHNVAPTALATAFDGTVLTVAAALTSKETVNQSLMMLASAQASLVGCVLVDRVYPTLSAEIDRQFRKLGILGRVLRWALRPLVGRLCAIEGQF